MRYEYTLRPPQPSLRRKALACLDVFPDIWRVAKQKKLASMDILVAGAATSSRPLSQRRMPICRIEFLSHPPSCDAIQTAVPELSESYPDKQFPETIPSCSRLTIALYSQHAAGTVTPKEFYEILLQSCARDGTGCLPTVVIIASIGSGTSTDDGFLYLLHQCFG